MAQSYGKRNTDAELKLMETYEQLYEADQSLTFNPPDKPLLDEFMLKKIQQIWSKLQDKTQCLNCGYKANYEECIKVKLSTYCPQCKLEHTGLECDWWMAVVGGEGQGKSTFVSSFLYEYCKVANKDFPKLLNTNVAFDEFDMLRLISKLDIKNKFNFIWPDEGANVFFARDSTSKLRKYSIKFSNSMRFLRYVVAICAVEIDQLDIIIRQHRIKSLIYIQEQGVYHYFNYERMRRLLLQNKGSRGRQFNWGSVEPNHIGRFGYSPETKNLVDSLKEKYMMRFKMEVENEYKRELLKKIKEEIR